MNGPKQPPKVMDFVHPHQVQPSATSRPGIISSRPYMKNDPMLQVINSSNNIAGAPAITTVETDISAKQEGSNEHETPAEPGVGSELVAGESHDVAEPKTVQSVEPIATEETSITEQEPAEVEENVPEDGSAVQETEHANKSGADAHDEEIERHIAAGTYAVPINSHSRRRRKIWGTILIVIFIILVATNIVADMNIISVPSWLPHTNLLSK